MNIFESLENLNVSEECFDAIMGIVEEVINENIRTAVTKKYGNPAWGRYRDGRIAPYTNKAADLINKAGESRIKELTYADKDGNWSREQNKRTERQHSKSPLTYDSFGKDLNYQDSKGKEPRMKVFKNPLRKQEENSVDLKDVTGFPREYEKAARYQHFKKLARKALRGHEQSGTTASEKSLSTKLSAAEKKAAYHRHSPNDPSESDLKNIKMEKENPRSYTKGKAERASWHNGISNPKELYRIGKAIEQHQNKQNKQK